MQLVGGVLLSPTYIVYQIFSANTSLASHVGGRSKNFRKQEAHYLDVYFHKGYDFHITKTLEVIS